MSSPIKKPEIIVTRKKSSEMKRKLRNTSKSMKRICQMTKMLRAPIYENNAELYYQNDKQNNKMKKNKDKISKKELEKKVSPKKIRVKQYVDKNKMADEKPPLIVEKESIRGVKIIKTYSEDFVPQKRKRGRKLGWRKNENGCKRKMDDIEKDAANSSKQSKISKSSPEHGDQISPSLKVKRGRGRPPIFRPPSAHPPSDTESLTHDDLYEILTCESPVWWEDLPDDYSENEIYKPSYEHYEPNKKIKIEKPEPLNLEISKNITLDSKFMQKRSKLENLLGNIKNKLVNINNDTPKTLIDDQNDEKYNNIENIKETKANITETDNNQNQTETETKINEQMKDDDSQNKTDSSESDDFHHFRDSLNDLENIDIPIEGQDSDVVVIEEEEEKSLETVVIDDEKNVHNTDSDKKYLDKDDVTDTLHDKEHLVVKTAQKNAPTTITSIEKECSSPISIKSSTLSDETSLSNVDNLDTISDTNITFIDEVNTDINEEIVETTAKEINKEIVNTNESKAKDSGKSFSRLKEAYKEFCNKQIKSISVKNETPSVTETKSENTAKNDETNKISQMKNVAEHVTQGNEKLDNNITTQKEQANDKTNIKEAQTSIKNDGTYSKDVNIPIIMSKDILENANNEKTKINSLHKKSKTSPKRRTKHLPTRVIIDEEKVANDKIIETKLNISILNSNTRTKIIKSYTKTMNMDQNTRKNDNKSASKIVSNGTVKYCMKCSSIFDTEYCLYCVRRALSITD